MDVGEDGAVGPLQLGDLVAPDIWIRVLSEANDWQLSERESKDVSTPMGSRDPKLKNKGCKTSNYDSIIYFRYFAVSNSN